MTSAKVHPSTKISPAAFETLSTVESAQKVRGNSGNHPGRSFFCNKFRYFILLLGLMSLTSIFSNMITLNFTLICMDPLEIVVKNTTQFFPLLNLTKRSNDDKSSPIFPIHHYSQYEKTLLQWTVSIASLLATFPFSWVCTKYGAKWTFFISGITSALSTAVIPPAANLSFNVFLFVRAIQGLAYACDFAVIGMLCTRWASLQENAMFLGTLTCFSATAAVVTNSMAGAICESSWGWPWVHYFHAIVSLIIFVVWIIFYTDDPSDSPFVSSQELAVIHRDKSEAHKKREPFTPYLEVTKDKVIWAVWMNAFADIFSGYFLLIYGPTYINNVLGYNTTETGLLGALIAFVHIPIKVLCGFASDTLHCWPERYKMRVFNTLALLSPAIIYIYLCFAPLSMPLVTVIMFGLVHIALGFNCGGFYKCGALVSRQYAEFVIACSQLIKCAVFFVAPAFVAIFVSDERNTSQWHIIFCIIASMLIVANVIFCLYATDEPRPFTKIISKNYQCKAEVTRLKGDP